jgi:hypothetical protein
VVLDCVGIVPACTLRYATFLNLVLQMVPQFQLIEVLQEHGIAANDIQKLQNAGYHTVESVRQASKAAAKQSRHCHVIHDCTVLYWYRYRTSSHLTLLFRFVVR